MSGGKPQPIDLSTMPQDGMTAAPAVQPWRQPFSAWRLTNTDERITELMAERGGGIGMEIVLVVPDHAGNAPELESYTADDGTVKRGYHLQMAAPFYGGDVLGVWVPHDYDGKSGIKDEFDQWTATPVESWEQDGMLNRSLEKMEPFFFKHFKESLMNLEVWPRISDKNQRAINRANSRVPTLHTLAEAAVPSPQYNEK